MQASRSWWKGFAREAYRGCGAAYSRTHLVAFVLASGRLRAPSQGDVGILVSSSDTLHIDRKPMSSCH